MRRARSRLDGDLFITSNARMSRVLCVTNNLTGIVNSSLELLCRLRAAGHQVGYAGFEPVRDAAAALDIDFTCLPDVGFAAFQKADGNANWFGRLARSGSRRQAALASLRQAEFASLLNESQPDLLLIDGEMHAHILTALAAGQRPVLLNTFVSIWRHAQSPPPHVLAIPGQGWRGSRLGIRLLWLGLDFKRWQLWRRRWLRRAGCDEWTTLKHLALELGLDYRRLVDRQQWLLPFTYRWLPVLSLHAREFEFVDEFPEQVHFTGPLVPARRPDARVSPENRQQLRRLFERTTSAAAAHKLVYAGFGSFFTTRRVFLMQLLESARRRPEWSWVISAGVAMSEEFSGQAPPNVLLLPWAPQLEVLEYADLAVTHGAINTQDECILAGVPMLNYPGHATDMPGSSSRASYHGVAITGDSRRDRADDILAHLDRLLSEERFAANVCRLQEAFSAYQRTSAAEAVVDRLLSRDPGLFAPSSKRQSAQSESSRR